jgi:membrane associated rhomboid family serine protease
MSESKDYINRSQTNQVQRDVLAGLVTLPLLLIMLHFALPASIQQALVFDYSDFPSYTVFTGAFIHASDMHLYRNLLGYTLVVAYAFALSYYSGGLRWFRRALLASVIILPILVNLTSYAILSWQYPGADPVSRGFSGVVGGFGGVLLVALYRMLRVKYNGDIAWTICLAQFLLLMQLIDIRYSGRLRPAVTGLVGLGITLVTGQYVYEHDPNLAELDDFRRAGYGVLLAVLVGAVLSVLILALFPQPSALVKDGMFTNIFAHAAGFFWGIVVSVGSLVKAGEVPSRETGVF